MIDTTKLAQIPTTTTTIISRTRPHKPTSKATSTHHITSTTVLQTSAVTTQSTAAVTPSTENIVSFPTESIGLINQTNISQDNPQNKQPGNRANNMNKSTTAGVDTETLLYQSNKVVETNDYKLNNLTFMLFGVMGVLSTLAGVLFYVWRKSSIQLHKNMNELYFVHKAYRQYSKARLAHNDMMDPVYADIGPRPEPPPRGVPSTSNETPTRSLSQTSETPLKGQCDEARHDYLELI